VLQDGMLYEPILGQGQRHGGLKATKMAKF